jgi:hypothetical protein
MTTDRGFTVWVTSASAAAANDVAVPIAEALARRGVVVELLGAEQPGFEWIPDARGLATVAGLLAAHGVTSVVAEAVSSRAVRDTARRTVGSMIEVVALADATPAATWEAPSRAEVEIDASAGAASVSRVLRTLEVLGHLQPHESGAYSEDEEREVLKRLKAFGYM